MSRKTYVEAIEYVLDSELDARDDLICLRPGARRALEEGERDVPLPRMGGASFSAALGAFLQGMHPVLDLRQESGAAQFLKDAVLDLPADLSPAITVIACAEKGLETLPGAYVFAPKTPRQAAGFMRSALKMNRLTLLLADQALFAEEDEIPEDRGFTLLPLDDGEGGLNEEAATDEEAAYEEAEAEEVMVYASTDEEAAYEEAETEEVTVYASMDEEAAYEEAEAEEVTVYAPMDEEAAYDETEAEEAAAESSDAEEAGAKAQPARGAYPAFRQTECNLTELRALCALLEMDEEMLIERCAGHVLPVCGGFELHTETDAPAGEAAFIPPEEEAASIWLGSDRLTVTYDPAQTAHADAAKLLRAVKRVLEKPQLLIYDKEYDG